MKIFNIYIVVGALFLGSCSKSLDVENINNPSTDAGLELSKGLAKNLFQQFCFYEQHNLNSPGPAMWVMADYGTVTYANFGTRDMSEEPRISLLNDPTYTYHSNYRNFWRGMYGIISSANRILKDIASGSTVIENGADATPMYEGFARMGQGLANGYIGLIFDQSYPLDETTDVDKLQLQPWEASVKLGVSQLKLAIDIFESNDFTISDTWINGKEYTSAELAQICHSYVARLMVYSPRNSTQASAVDWMEVVQHIDNGIQGSSSVHSSSDDFAITSDGRNGNWMAWAKYYMARDDWGKIDMRIVNMIDPTLPANWPGEKTTNQLPNRGIITTIDKRANGDDDDGVKDYFVYKSDNNRPERGYYRWSSYRCAKYDEWIDGEFYGQVPLMTIAEMQTLKAEAELRLGHIDIAINIINSGTRTQIGGLPILVDTSTEQEVAEAIQYERNMELTLVGLGLEYFDMRRHDQLQDGSLLHFPVPAQQLEVEGLPFYTFGGFGSNSGVQGEDVAINGWYNPTLVIN